MFLSVYLEKTVFFDQYRMLVNAYKLFHNKAIKTDFIQRVT